MLSRVVVLSQTIMIISKPTIYVPSPKALILWIDFFENASPQKIDIIFLVYYSAKMIGKKIEWGFFLLL